MLETRASKSRPTAGLVKVKTTGLNQHGDVVIEFTRTFMVWKRGHVPKVVRRAPPEKRLERLQDSDYRRGRLSRPSKGG